MCAPNVRYLLRWQFEVGGIFGVGVERYCTGSTFLQGPERCDAEYGAKE